MMQVPLNPGGQMIATCGRVNWFNRRNIIEFQESYWMNNALQYRQRVEYELRILRQTLQLNKTFKKIYCTWIAFIILMILSLVIIVLTSSTDDARVWIFVLEGVLLLATIIIQVVLIVGIQRKIKQGLERISSVLQSARINLYLRLKEDSCLVKTYGRIYYRFNYIEVYQYGNY